MPAPSPRLVRSFILAALLGPTVAAAQDGLTATGVRPTRALAPAAPDVLTRAAAWVTPRDQSAREPVGMALDRLVVLVRHAEKAEAPRADPPLTDAGRARAEALARATEAAGIGAVIVTPFARTRETAAPTAAARGVTPVEIPVGRSVAEHVAAVAEAVRAQPAGVGVLVVGHSNTIPAIVTALGGPRLPDLCDTQYAVLYVLAVPDTGPARLVTASYGAPDPPEGACPVMR